MTCCHVRVAPAGSPAFQYTRRKVEAECGSFCVLVAGGDDAIGFVLVAGLEGFLFLGGEVFAVVNSPRTEEHTVALFHVLLHVLNMNQPEPISSASSGRVCAGCSRVFRLLKFPLQLDRFSSKSPTKRLEARVGIEPTNAAFAEPCLTTWLPRPQVR